MDAARNGLTRGFGFACSSTAMVSSDSDESPLKRVGVDRGLSTRVEDRVLDIWKRAMAGEAWLQTLGDEPRRSDSVIIS